MNGRRVVDVILGTLSASACSGLICAGMAFAGVQDSRFEFSPDGASVDFDVRDTPRRDVLNQLFAGSGIDFKWIDAVFADERIGGRFNGTPAAVARQLLAQTNFVIVHDGSGAASRVVRVVIVGPAKGEHSSAGLTALAAAIRPVLRPKELPKPDGGGAPARPEIAKPLLKAQLADAVPPRADNPETSAAAPARANGTKPQMRAGPAPSGGSLAVSEPRGDLTGLLKPPPAGAKAPLPVVPPGAEAPPLIAPAQDITALPLTPAVPGAAAPALGPAPAGRAKN